MRPGEEPDRFVRRQAVLDVMRRIGMTERIAEAGAVLPDPVGLERDAALLRRFNLSLDGLTEELGGSP
jgi:hypothetical protein